MCPPHTLQLSSSCTERPLDKEEALPASLKHPGKGCKGMATRLWVVHFSFSGVHVVLNPAKVATDVGVDPRLVLAAAADAPADDAYQVHPLLLHADQRPSRVTLQGSSRLVTNSFLQVWGCGYFCPLTGVCSACRPAPCSMHSN